MRLALYDTGVSAKYGDKLITLSTCEYSEQTVKTTQAAEGSFNTRYPHEPNGIQDPEYSIECGVQELKAALISAEVESPIDMERIKLALQGYNFGNGYISWAKSNYAAIPMPMPWSSPPCRHSG